MVVRTIDLPEITEPTRITARLTIHPLPKDDVSVFDPWDRAGDIRLATADSTDIQIVKFITSYGGMTDYEVDVSQLAPLLQGECTIKASIDTWLNPAWEIDFTLRFETDTSLNPPTWAAPLFLDKSFDRARADSGGVAGTVIIPANIKRVKMYYLTSGHCTDGRDADEFVSKDNVLSVDSAVVYRYRPWRDDCRQFRDVNPYTRRWSDGWWSSDYSRSGWCPGDIVSPLELDLTDHLTPGAHSVRAMIENIRPKGKDNQFGYWRVSAYVVGWTEK